MTAELMYYQKMVGLNIEDNEELILQLMIEFAKIKVTEALQAASKMAIVGSWADDYEIDKDSILNAYDLNLIV